MLQLRENAGRKIRKLDLFEYQHKAVEFLRKRHGRAGLFMKMRSGKTRAVLSYLRETDARRVLVVCPKSAAYVWRDELKIVNPEARPLIAVDKTLPRAEALIERASKIDKVIYLIVNWETFWRHPSEDKWDPKLKKLKRLPLRGIRRAILRHFRPDTIIWDEAHRLGYRTAKQSKFAHLLVEQDYVERAIPLTGTSATEGVERLFSLYKAFDRSVFGADWSDFNARYIIRGGYGGYKILGYRNLKEIERKVNRTAYQYEGAPDDIDDVVIPVALGPKTRQAYAQMSKDALAEIEGVDDDGKPLSGKALARIVLTKLLRLQQICSGFVVTDNGVAFIGDEKLKVARELVSDAHEDGRRVVIFYRFKPELQRLMQAFPKAGLINGSVKSKQRKWEEDALRSGERDVLLVQIRAGGVSIDLSGANVQIFYSVGYSLTDFLQARSRLVGPKQESSVTSYMLQARNTVEVKVFKALSKKQRLARRVTSLTYARDLLA